jgi:hypothetical protein
MTAFYYSWMIRHKFPLCFFTVSVFFVLLNFFTLSWTPLPWVDEAMFADTPVNFLESAQWKTTAWNAGANGSEPVSTANPLFQVLMVVWMKIFGFSLESCRSLNIFLAFCLSGMLVCFLRKRKILNEWTSLLLFLTLFWGAESFSWSYRNGRLDILNIICSFWFITSFFRYIERQGKAIFLFLSAVFVFLSGLQAAPFIVACLIWLFFIHKPERRRILVSGGLFVAGVAAGFFALMLPYALNGHLLTYLERMLLYSATLGKIMYRIQPYFAELFHWNMEHVFYSGKQTFLQNLIMGFIQNKEYALLAAFNISALLLNRVSVKSKDFLYVASCIFIPFFMCLAGRFQSYYTWMCYLPAVIGFIYLYEKYGTRNLRLSGVALVLFVFCFGLPKTLLKSDRTAYRRIEHFIQRQAFSKDTKIVAPFMSYYAIRNITSTCYFAGVYPLSYIPEDTQYILRAERTDGHKNEIDGYIQDCINKGKTLSPIDSLESPQMTLYLVSSE